VSRAPFIAARCRLKGERHARDGVDHKTTGRSTIERRPHWQAELAGAPSARVRQLDAVKIETRASPLHAGDPRDRDKGQPSARAAYANSSAGGWLRCPRPILPGRNRGSRDRGFGRRDV